MLFSTLFLSKNIFYLLVINNLISSYFSCSPFTHTRLHRPSVSYYGRWFEHIKKDCHFDNLSLGSSGRIRTLLDLEETHLHRPSVSYYGHWFEHIKKDCRFDNLSLGSSGRIRTLLDLEETRLHCPSVSYYGRWFECIKKRLPL